MLMCFEPVNLSQPQRVGLSYVLLCSVLFNATFCANTKSHHIVCTHYKTYTYTSLLTIYFFSLANNLNLVFGNWLNR